jgi:hypothetical protein
MRKRGYWFIIKKGKILLSSSSMGMLFSLSWFDDVEATFARMSTSLPLLKIIALAFSLGFTIV